MNDKDFVLYGEFTGEIPIREDITILPADDPNKLRLGWVIFEFEDEYSYQKHIKEKEGVDALKKYLYNNHPSRQKETDKADIYRGYNGSSYVDPESTSGGTIEVLPQLNGKPFNNEAINLIHSVRPSCIRVTTDRICLDARQWRVTVYLKKDDITIRKIEQEVQIGCYGHGEYKDVSNKPSADHGPAVINEKALKKIKVK